MLFLIKVYWLKILHGVRISLITDGVNQGTLSLCTCTIPRGTGCKMNVQNMFTRHPGRFLNVLCTFDIPVFRGHGVTSILLNHVNCFLYLSQHPWASKTNIKNLVSFKKRKRLIFLVKFNVHKNSFKGAPTNLHYSIS